jgi:hypothetical protein
MEGNSEIASMRRPERCPCCGGPLVEDYNSRGKYRIFAYACGARGWQDERTEYDRAILAERVVRIGDIDWESSCPDAMAYLSLNPNSRLISSA